ncbi:MAG TPA: hypothetical protein VGG01_24730 [Xanthobacteraceae bacterium]|jgi:hypothetical protein
MNPWFDIARDAGRLAVEAPSVVMLRVARLARGGKRGRGEAQRMVVEKVVALGEANAAAARSLLAGEPPPEATRKALKVYSRRVKRNRRRLTPGWWGWW